MCQRSHQSCWRSDSCSTHLGVAKFFGSSVALSSALGLLFLGIQFMGDATRPLRTFQRFIDAMQYMENPLLGILLGAIFTAVVQSSAATLAIVIALASQGLMPLEAGISFFPGVDICCFVAALLGVCCYSPSAAPVSVFFFPFK